DAIQRTELPTSAFVVVVSVNDLDCLGDASRRLGPPDLPVSADADTFLYAVAGDGLREVEHLGDRAGTHDRSLLSYFRCLCKDRAARGNFPKPTALPPGESPELYSLPG